MPLVANRHHHGGRLPRGGIYVGRGTPLGNPFSKDEYPDALERFRRWLHQKIKARDPVVCRALRNIDDESVLVCSCAPKPCHAYVIRSAWEYLVETGMIFQLPE